MFNSKKGFTLAEVMIVVGIIAILAAITIPNLLRAKVNANQSAAQAALKTISNALENYFAINNTYPNSTNALIIANPPYLNLDFFTGTHNGYTFNSVLTNYDYTITATPTAATYGTLTYTVTTGGIMSSN